MILSNKLECLSLPSLFSLESQHIVSLHSGRLQTNTQILELKMLDSDKRSNLSALRLNDGDKKFLTFMIKLVVT